MTDKKHARLGASVASRWMACPGSPRLARQVPAQEGPASQFAQDGTNAHTLGEACLSFEQTPDVYLGMTPDQTWGFEVTEDMVEAVRVYTDYCQDIARTVMSHSGGRIFVEHQFSLESLKPPEPMFGTADFVAYDAQTQTLHVVDLKYGQGVIVEVLGNKQTRYYALGAALSPEIRGLPITDVIMTIVQPRAAHADGPVRSEAISFLELIEFGAELLYAANRTQDPNAALVPGSHCRFCPASGVCPAQRDQAQALAQIEFSVETPSAPPAPETMPLAMVLDMLPKLHVLENWISAMRAHVRSRLESGEDVPGWKLVDKRANRTWADEAAVEQALARHDDDVKYEPRTLKSVAQIEKALGKKAFAASPLPALVVKKSSGVKMVPAHDPAPAVSVLTVQEEFPALPSGN